MFYANEYANRKRPQSHMHSKVPELGSSGSEPQQAARKRARRASRTTKHTSEKKTHKTLESGGHHAAEEAEAEAAEVKLFQLDKRSTWAGSDQNVKGSNSDRNRYFSSA